MPMSKTDAALLRRQIKRAETLEFLACRVGGTRHRWVQCIPDFEPPYKNAHPVVHQCDVCDTIKRQVLTRNGERLGDPDYEYPSGYMYRREENEDSIERLFSPQAVRAAMLSRTKVADLPSLRLTHREEEPQ